MGLPMPSGFDGYFLEDELTVPLSKRSAKLAEAETLPKALLTDIDVNWLQVIGEGWAAPLKGFMREGPLMQALHFNSILIDPFNSTGAVDINVNPTDWNDYGTRGRERVSMDRDGKTLAILRNPEIYENRKEEIVTRCFGAIDMGHPYIKHIYQGGDWLLGGEIELLQRVTYNDGLDQYRLTPKEMYAAFEEKG
eukprot:CAMPEP_0171891258 /NCGR_PEP_ID=MMETSP0992-20121227/44637_1 /TAXON_ID=483369 /ORGANISM="non described non described, Strain CCMP2098" /LENGTH=193 /DNA_ID=CAMNT_0012518569 /DNA_START=36 /DNA_END=614 /DNA_ORIENTATION=+